MRPVRLIALFWLLLTGALPTRALAQDQGLAAITSPVTGANVSGVVVLTGTATHPSFQQYELAFSYDPNPTDTWFTIQASATAPVLENTLGAWDTTDIMEGVYALRLRVYSSDGSVIETVVQNVRVMNAGPTANAPMPTSAPGSTPIAAVTPTLTGPVVSTLKVPATVTPTAPLIILSPVAQTTSGARPITSAAGVSGAGLQTAFLAGVRLTAVAFGLLGLYTGLRYVWRIRLRR